jgi:hypothetical protein
VPSGERVVVWGANIYFSLIIFSLEELKESLRSNKQNLAKVTCNHDTPIKKLVIETVSLEERISRLEKKKVDEVVQFPLEFGFRNLYCFHGL